MTMATRSFRKTQTALAILVAAAFSVPGLAVNTSFHNAPDSAKQLKNPYAGQKSAVQAGKALYAEHCAKCHGRNAEGTGNIPALVDGQLESVSAGEVFWFVTHGDPNNGMPAWSSLPAKQRWQIVTLREVAGAIADFVVVYRAHRRKQRRRT